MLSTNNTQAICSLKLIYYTMHIIQNIEKKNIININIFVAGAIEGSPYLSLWQCARSMACCSVAGWRLADHFRMYLGECDNGTNRHKRY